MPDREVFGHESSTYTCIATDVIVLRSAVFSQFFSRACVLLLSGMLSAILLGAAELSQHSSGKASKRAHAALHAMLPLHRATSAASLAVSERAQKRWDLLRMHFLEFPRHSCALTRQKWHAVIEAALERKRELKHRHQVPPPPSFPEFEPAVEERSASPANLS